MISSVRAWIRESDRELVRLDAEAIDTLSIGFGLLARLHKGAKLSFLRTKVNDEVWLPSRVSFSGSARVDTIFTAIRSPLRGRIARSARSASRRVRSA